MNGTITNPTPLWMRIVVGRNPKRTLVRLICLVTVSMVLFHFIFIPIRVSGFSMLPTYTDGKVNLVNHMAYLWHKPRRGDVIALRWYADNVVLLKRIVGLPGEHVQIIKGRVWINGKPLEESYARFGKKAPVRPEESVMLDNDEYYVIGDNRDITVAGPISERAILGKVLF
jgi:signal peptidase I